MGIRHASWLQAVENYEYETPSEFEDEEIDEDLAFTAEDEQQFGDMMGGKAAADEAEDSADGEQSAELPESDDEELSPATKVSQACSASGHA